MTTKKKFFRLFAMLIVSILFVSCNSSTDETMLDRPQQAIIKSKLAAKAVAVPTNDIHGKLTIKNSTPFKFNNVRLYCYILDDDYPTITDPNQNYLAYQEVNIPDATYNNGMFIAPVSTNLADFASTSSPSPTFVLNAVPKWYFETILTAGVSPHHNDGDGQNSEYFNTAYQCFYTNQNPLSPTFGSSLPYTAWKGIYKYGASNAVDLITDPIKDCPILAFNIRYNPSDISVMTPVKFTYNGTAGFSGTHYFVTTQNVDIDGNITIGLNITP